jgi:thymidine kinase
MRSRYKKFKEAEFFNELTGLVKGLTDKEQKPVIIYVLKYKFPN